ncbi:SGNH hydrolase domain-containing protein [Candidatus Thiothrix sp. Deng01]|uniref:SGNH hydrolase domain-containing protein n=1 Tax=Candidatus Thiothrix phosphatis TaxID=3112415 RepID=A0ABU6CX19_9GAMM|nr:SGNH hydrolase domain-containing protein [Candidatus Thiothrix sp. Deng01]MEB4591329.1 SGNH hydrolase domain-containing protein [Candidatus Thiothrix sp. Deng01]
MNTTHRFRRFRQFSPPFLSIPLLLGAFVFSPCWADSTVRNALLQAADHEASGQYVRERFLSLMKKPFQANAGKKVLILGDSHAQDFVNMVFESGHWQGYQISTRDIPTRCQPVLGANAATFLAVQDQAFCAEADSLEKAQAQIAEADIVILAANWKAWAAQELPTTISHLKLTPQQKLFVIGRKSFGKVAVRNYLRMTEEELRNVRNKPDAEQEKINGIMKTGLDGNVFIDLQQQVCESPSSCQIFTDNLQLVSFDGGHLTKDGARYIGGILFRQTPLGQL